MAKTNTQQHEEVLRYRVRQYLRGQGWGTELKKTLQKFETEGCSVYIVGGFLRDLMLYGPSASPRDIDIVFEGVPVEKVEFFFWNQKERKNRFGGLRLKSGDCPFDVWSLRDTWAFRNKKVHRVSFSTLPHTAFLNLDAIALRWKDNSEDEVVSNGFFEGISNRTLEINLEENPFPETCIVRALIAASTLDFAIGPKLAAYIFRYSKKTSLTELQRVQRGRYGFIPLDGEDLRSCFSAIEAQLSRSRVSTVSLPGKQFKFEDQRTQKENKPKNILVEWISNISEAAFVHSRAIRRFRKQFIGSKRSTLNVFNTQIEWLSKVS